MIQFLVDLLLCLFGGGSVVVGESYLRIHRKPELPRIQNEIRAGTTLARQNRLANGLRSNLTRDDVAFLCRNGWEPETPEQRRLAIGGHSDSELSAYGFRPADPDRDPDHVVEAANVSALHLQAALDRARFFQLHGFFPGDPH